MSFSASYANLVTTLLGTSGDNAGLDIRGRLPGQTLRIEGATSLATLTTGLNSFTAGTGTSSTSVAKQTASADYTATNLVGKQLKRVGGGGYVSGGDNLRFILSNTTTTIAINEMEGLDNTSVCQIVDPATDATRISVSDLIAIRVASCLGPVEIVGLDFSATHTLDGLVEITDCVDVRILACKFAQNLANPSLSVERCARLRVDHCHWSAGADAAITDCVNVSGTGNVNAAGGVFDITDCNFVSILKHSAASAPSRVISIARAFVVDLEAACSSGGASPIYLEDCNHMRAVGNLLTGTGNTGYGVEFAHAGQYNITGSTITGTTNDALFDTRACSYALELSNTYGRMATSTMGLICASNPTKTIVLGNQLYDGSGDHAARELYYGVFNPAQNIGLTATGTNLATAYQCPAGSFYSFGTVASGTGAIFHDASALAGVEVTYVNKGANALTLYAPRGTIDGGASYSLAVGARKKFVINDYAADEWFSL